MSEVLARRFTDRRHLLTRFTIATRYAKDVGVSGFGRTPAIYPQDPRAFEAGWQMIETRLPEAFAAVDDGSVFANLGLVDLLKDCLSVHLARGRTVARVHRRVAQEDRPALEQRLAARPWVDEDFRRTHSGLRPAGDEARRMHVAEMIDEGLAQLAASSFTPDRMVALYDQIRPLVSRSHLEIGIATEGDFLIGDTPAVSLRQGNPGVGPLGGVPWDRANTIVMPIGRRHMLALGRKPGYIDLDRAAVDYLNWVQIAAAEAKLAWHPDATLRAFVTSALDARAAAAIA